MPFSWQGYSSPSVFFLYHVRATGAIDCHQSTLCLRHCYQYKYLEDEFYVFVSLCLGGFELNPLFFFWQEKESTFSLV